MKNKKLTIALTATGLASATLVSLFAINKVIGKVSDHSRAFHESYSLYY